MYGIRQFSFEQGKKMVDLKSITKFALDATLSQDGLFLPFDEDIVLMQYTGLKDKNGVEVYEGDVIRTVLPKPTPFVLTGEVKFIERGFWIEINGSLFWPKTFRVIGNIYENPELLEKEKVIGHGDGKTSEN
jgi:hypothetical protein